MHDTNLPDLAAGIRDSRLARLYAYWHMRKGIRRFPARRDLDPVDLRYVLGHLLLIDVLRDPLRFRVRLHGSEITTRVRYDLTGKLLDELPDPDYRDYVVGRCQGLVKAAEPLVVRKDRSLDGRVQGYEALWLPFSEDGSEITMLLCGLVYDEVRRRAAA
jgi:hypothetical protein